MIIHRLSFRFMDSMFGVNNSKKMTVDDVFSAHTDETVKVAGNCLERYEITPTHVNQVITKFSFLFKQFIN